MSPGASKNLVLTGFMATGKTAVGRKVAARLGRPFVDTDALITEQTGRTIPNLFAELGEVHFRNLEAETVRSLAAQQGLVIATGGWTLGTAENRDAMAANSLIVCLTAPAPELIRRLAAEQGPDGRPMLADDEDWQLRLEVLLARRQPGYRQIALQVDTAGRTIDQVADRVLALWSAFGESGPPLAVPVSHPAPGYQVLIGHGLLDRFSILVDCLSPALPDTAGSPLVVVTDRNVGPLHGARLTDRSPDLLKLIQMPAGEEHKTLDTVRWLYEQFLAARLDRGGTVVVLGGGVVGDVAGYAAATYLRGVRLVQIPTTLLSMVDSSVGAKTGVDLPEGKNLIGAFKQPALVLVDPSILGTLPAVEVQSGLGEVVKHGILGDPILFEDLERWEPEAHNCALCVERSQLDSWIARAIAVKRDVVEADPFETGRRATLNLGHTFGHAIEKCSGYRVRHGQAVAIGLVAASRTSARLGLCVPELPGRIERLLRRLGLPTRYQDSTPDDLLAAMGTDKKRLGRRLRFVLPLDIGQVTIADEVPHSLVLDVLSELRLPEGA